MATTTNYGWTTPNDTDLVKDGASAIRTLGQSIDTTFAELKGGTSGQMLTKASATDLDLVWVTPEIGDITSVTATSPLTGGGTTGAVTVAIQDATTAQKGSVQLSDSTSTTSSVLAATPTAVKSAYDLAAAAVPKSTVTTAGDIIYRNATVPTRLGIGTAGQVLQVNAGATAPEWATPSSGGGMTLINTGGTALTGASVTIGSIPSTYKSLRLVIVNYNSANANAGIRFRINSDANTRYSYITVTGGAAATFGQTSGNFATDNSTASTQGLTVAEFPDYANATTWKFASVYSALNNYTTSTSAQLNMGMSVWNQTGAITSLDLLAYTGNLSGGTAYLYGVK